MNVQHYVTLILMIIFAGLLLYQKVKCYNLEYQLSIEKELFRIEIQKRKAIGFRSCYVAGDVMRGILTSDDKWARVYKQLNARSELLSTEVSGRIE